MPEIRTSTIVVADRRASRPARQGEVHARCSRCRVHVWVDPDQRENRNRRKIVCSVCVAELEPSG